VVGFRSVGLILEMGRSAAEFARRRDTLPCHPKDWMREKDNGDCRRERMQGVGQSGTCAGRLWFHDVAEARKGPFENITL
jgi:hypothetical protein